MTLSRVPRLSDLILLWLEEKIGKGHKVQYGGGNRMRSYLDISDYSLKVDGVIIGWIYDDRLELLFSQVGKIIKPEDPAFFDMLWTHMDKVSDDFDPLYQERLTTYLKSNE